MSKLNDSDDYLHEPNNCPDFRESYYFNWVDEPSGVSGFSTIGLLPNAKKREFVFALFYDDKREVYWKEPEGAISENIDVALSNGTLSFELVNPMNDWKIVYQGEELAAEILWKGRFPYYDFGGGSGTSWAGHFEQSGIVKGTVTLQDGRELKINGLGERDKSWGSRDWHIEGWYAFHAQFKDVSIGLRRDQVKGEFIPSGGISKADGFVPITRVDLETKYIEDPIKIPFAAKTTVHGEDGSVYTCHSKTLSPTSFVRFEREFKGGSTELFENMAVHVCEELNERGSGLLEWLFTHKK